MIQWSSLKHFALVKVPFVHLFCLQQFQELFLYLHHPLMGNSALRLSVLFSSPINDCNVVPDRCMSPWRASAIMMHVFVHQSRQQREIELKTQIPNSALHFH